MRPEIESVVGCIELLLTMMMHCTRNHKLLKERQNKLNKCHVEHHFVYDSMYPGSFILMNTQQHPKLMTMAANPTICSIILLSLGVLGL